MAIIPDELWRKILEIGVQSCGFTYKDLCCCSISCRRLSDETLFWNQLLSSDIPLAQTSSANLFPNYCHSSATSSSSKSVYKIRFKKDKEKRIATHRSIVFRKESQIAEHSRKLKHRGEKWSKAAWLRGRGKNHLKAFARTSSSVVVNPVKNGERVHHVRPLQNPKSHLAEITSLDLDPSLQRSSKDWKSTSEGW